MIPVQNFYTGHSSLPVRDYTGLEQSLREYTRQQYAIGRDVLNRALQRQRELMDFTSVTPMAALNTKQRADDLADIEQFKKFAIEKTKGVKGRSTAALMEVQQAKEALIANQLSRRSMNEMVIQELDIISRDPEDYDTDFFQKKLQGFYETNDYTPGLLPSLVNLDDIAEKTMKAVGVPYSKDTVVTSGDTQTRGTDVELRVDFEEAYKDYSNRLDPKVDQRANRTAVQEFTELSPQEQERFLNKADETGKNAVVLASMDRHVRLKKDIRKSAVTKKDDVIPGVEVNQEFGVGGTSADKKSGWSYAPVYTSAQFNDNPDAPAITFHESQRDKKIVPLPTDMFPELIKLGYPKGQYIDADMIAVKGDQVEAMVSPAAVKVWEDATTGQIYADSQVSGKMGDMGFVDGKMVNLVTKKDKRITVTGNVQSALGNIEQKWAGFTDSYKSYYKKYQEVQSKKPTDVGGLFKKIKHGR